jgi:hypothetical protein
MADNARAGSRTGSASGQSASGFGETALDPPAHRGYHPRPMKPIIPFLALSALCAGVGWSLFAAEAPAPRVTGKVLILHNERAFEGDIEKVGDDYRVRRGSGEIVVTSSQALRLCADWDEALAFMRSRANLDDPDERLRLAKWCMGNHQVEHALAEAKIAMTMRPKHGETRTLVKVLEVTPAGKTTRPASEPTVAPVPQIDLSFESVTAFDLRIQPILMNTCVSCHAGTYTGKFRLYRQHEGGTRVALHRNLAAVLSSIALDRPAASPLLVMAVCAHGDAKTPPIAGRQSPAFSTLCGWIDQMIADNPHLRERGSAPLAASVGPGKLPTVKAPVVPQLPPLPGVFAAQNAPTIDGAPAPPPIVLPAKAPATAPTTPAGPLDDFDVARFNGVYHPNRK